MDLLDLLTRPEGKTLEFKRDLSSPEGALRSIVSFANTGGGTLLVGVEDATGHVRGLKEPLATEERLASLISDSISPRLVPDIELLPWRLTHVLSVQVYPSPLRPHYLTREGTERGVYVRVGSTNRRADRELCDEMRRYARGESYDEQPLVELDSEAINFRAASESFAPVRKLKRADLETLRLLCSHQGRKVPTVGGILLFGCSRERHFPDAWVQVGRFAGTDKARILDQAELRGGLVLAIEEGIAFVHKHTLHGVEVGHLRRSARPNLPPVAVREAIINAVAHADYAQRGSPIRISLFDDRLEVESPGLLPLGLVVDDLRRGVSKLRNRVIGRVLHELGLIEQWGSGIARMSAACHEAGLPAPLLEELGTRFRVTIVLARVAPVAVDPTDQALLAALEAAGGRTTAQLATVSGLSTRATRTRLVALVGAGLVREVGTGPQDPKRCYYRARRE